jgi:hypothetical protein
MATQRYYSESSQITTPSRNEGKVESKIDFYNESDTSSRSPPSSLSSNDSVYFSESGAMIRPSSSLRRSQSTDYRSSPPGSSLNPRDNNAPRGGLRTRRPPVTQTAPIGGSFPLCGAKTSRGHCARRRSSCPWAEHRSPGARSPLEAPCLKHPQYTIRSCRRCARAEYRKACFG